MTFLLFTCRHLLQNSSMTLDTMSDLTRDILELADNDITDKVTVVVTPSELQQFSPVTVVVKERRKKFIGSQIDRYNC